jgi:hypothetical protein
MMMTTQKGGLRSLRNAFYWKRFLRRSKKRFVGRGATCQRFLFLSLHEQIVHVSSRIACTVSLSTPLDLMRKHVFNDSQLPTLFLRSSIDECASANSPLVLAKVPGVWLHAARDVLQCSSSWSGLLFMVPRHSLLNMSTTRTKDD